MIIFNSDKEIFGNRLEVHYWFNDETHSMNAVIQNKCEYQIIGLIKDVAQTLNLEIDIETEPLGEGGLRKWLKVISKSESKSATISTAILVALITTILITPIGKISEKAIDKLFEDSELKQLEKEKLRLEIKKLEQETSIDLNDLNKESAIKKKKSNFYDSLHHYDKLTKVSYKITDESKTITSKEKTVEKTDFKYFILASDDLEPIEKDNVNIEIISPVLKRGGNYKWAGFYNEEPISFRMKSDEFKTMVQTGEIEFKNGSSINCHLLIKRKMNELGQEINVGYEVLRVNHYFENDKPIETKEGKQHRRKKQAEKDQLNLFANNETSFD